MRLLARREVKRAYHQAPARGAPKPLGLPGPPTTLRPPCNSIVALCVCFSICVCACVLACALILFVQM